MNDTKELERIRSLSERLLAVLREDNADDATYDMVMTRLLAAMYSMQTPDVAERLIKLHCDNLRCSVAEIRALKAKKT